MQLKVASAKEKNRSPRGSISGMGYAMAPGDEPPFSATMASCMQLARLMRHLDSPFKEERYVKDLLVVIPVAVLQVRTALLPQR